MKLITIYSEVKYLGFKHSRKDLKKIGRIISNIFYRKNIKAYYKEHEEEENGAVVIRKVRTYPVTKRGLIHKTIQKFYDRKKKNSMGKDHSRVSKRRRIPVRVGAVGRTPAQA